MLTKLLINFFQFVNYFSASLLCEMQIYKIFHIGDFVLDL